MNDRPTPTPREAREAAGFGGKEGLERLAKRVNRSVQTLQKIERGYRPPEPLARRLCVVLGCSPDTYLLPDSAFDTGRSSRGRSAKTHSRRGPQTTRRETPSLPASSNAEQAPSQARIKAPDVSFGPRYERLKRGLTAEEVARRAGYRSKSSASYVLRIERDFLRCVAGDRKVQLAPYVAARNLARAIGCPLDVFYTMRRVKTEDSSAT